jgi:hypothetical protein
MALTDDSLNPADVMILDLLGDGRETTGSLADQLEKHENYVGSRIKRLREHGHVRYHHQPTALHELVDDPRQSEE